MAAPTPDRRARLAALDAFRGLTVAGMLLVNNQGDGGAAYAQLRHSAWHGWTAADLVFPFFVFVAGITTQLSLGARRASEAPGARRHVLRRAWGIFAIGLLLNWYPFYESAPGVHGLAGQTALRLEHLRILGVLQRIALAYLGTVLLTWRASTRRVTATAAALLIGYWALVTLVPVPGERVRGAALMGEPCRTLVAWVDRAVLDWSRFGLGNHLWTDTRCSDPEGLLSTIPAVATAMLGVLAGRWLGDASRPLPRRTAGLAAAGALTFAAGTAWGLVFPVNKQLWTSSYVLVAGGLAALVLAGVVWIVDGRGWRRGLAPLIAFGANPLVAYAGSELLAHVLHSSIRIPAGDRHLPTETWTVRALVGGGVSLPAASLAYSLGFVALMYLGMQWLYRRRIYVKL